MKNLSPELVNPGQLVERRKFIITAIKATCAATLLQSATTGYTIGYKNNDLTIQLVIDLILKEIPGAPFKETVDTIKSGNIANKVKGIITTMFATVEVIQEAIQLNANFIIAHEPTFYNHTDDVKWVENNQVVAQKEALLSKHNITIWRFHDYWHKHQPDGIFYGVAKKAGWFGYCKPGEPTFTIPADSLKNIALHLKASLEIEQLSVIGDLSKLCKKITLLPGAAGGQMQLKFAEKDKPDLLIVGEVNEWETPEYIRDARALGNNISLIILGHSLSEEPGMEWLAEWLQPKIPSISVKHIASRSPFLFI